MKKIVPFLKVILAIFFLYNIGIFSLLSNLPKGKTLPVKADFGKEDIKYLNEKIRKAEALEKDYEPENYFADIFEIQSKETKNDFDRSTVLSVNHTRTTLMEIFNRNVKRHRIDDTEAEYKNFLNKLALARGKYFPENNRKADICWKKVFGTIITWIWNFYLKNFFLAVLLLWCWWYEEKEKITINNPVSFIICCVLYPVIISRVWINSIRFGARVFAMSVAFKRRQADIFSMISDDELSTIRVFARSSLKISDYQNYLESRGNSCRQALIPAIAITIIFLVVPRPAESKAAESDNHVKIEVCIKAPPLINPGGGEMHHHDFAAADLPAKEIIFVMTLVWRLIIPRTCKKFQGFQTNPDPVPVVA